jgi:hypothetical protein
VSTARRAVPTDEELVAAARGGDAGALDALVRRHESRLYRFGLKMCGSREAAGDGVPKVVMNDQVELLGAQPEGVFVDAVLRAAA